MSKSPSSLDTAVELFVEGDYAEAIDHLEAITRRRHSKEILTETYLYLGRAYMALGQYNRAIDAFSVGASYGSASPFREYLLRLRRIVESSPEKIAKSAKISRGQLALTVDLVVYGRVPGDGGGVPDYEDDGLDGCVSVQDGTIPALPDGNFHAEEFVTRGSFYVVVCRLLHREAVSAGVEAIFPGGFTWVTGGESGTEDPKECLYVSGKEAVSILQRVAGLREELNGG